MRNQIEKEEAMKQEFQAMKGAAADPFTRRHSRPTLVTKVSDLHKVCFYTRFFLSPTWRGHLDLPLSMCASREVFLSRPYFIW